jgi:hypothetical protein
MVQRNAVCPKCQGKMDVGVVPDETFNRTLPSTWYEGVPTKGFFGLKVRGNKSFEIMTYRCTACGYLESYAGP